MSLEVQNKRQTRYGIIYSDDMRRLFVGTNMTKEFTFLDEDLGQMGLLKTLNAAFFFPMMSLILYLFTLLYVMVIPVANYRRKNSHLLWR